MDKIKLNIKVPKIGTGHIPHKSGSGKHADRRTKRNRTRSSQNRTAINE